jgi:hypothetical protein
MLLIVLGCVLGDRFLECRSDQGEVGKKDEMGRAKDHFWSSDPAELQKVRPKTAAGRPQEAACEHCFGAPLA